MPSAGDDLRREIERLRTWKHDTNVRLAAVEWQLTTLLEQGEKLSAQVESMAREDQIAAAVAERLKGQRGVSFTTLQKVFVAAVASVPLVSLILQATGRV